MLKLSYNPVINTTIPIHLEFKDSAGKRYIPATIAYTFLALKDDKNSWKIVDELYKKQVQPSSQVAILIPSKSNKTVEGTLLRRQVRIEWSAYVNNQICDFEEIVEFDVNPQPIINGEIPTIDDTIPLTRPQISNLIEWNEDSTSRRFLRLVFDFPVNAELFEEDTFRIDDENAEPEIDSTCTQLTFDISTLEKGEHKIEVGEIESLIVGSLEPFEATFFTVEIAVSSIRLEDATTQSLSKTDVTLAESLVGIVSAIEELQASTVEIREKLDTLETELLALPRIEVDVETLQSSVQGAESAIEDLTGRVETIEQHL